MNQGFYKIEADSTSIKINFLYKPPSLENKISVTCDIYEGDKFVRIKAVNIDIVLVEGCVATNFVVADRGISRQINP